MLCVKTSLEATTASALRDSVATRSVDVNSAQALLAHANLLTNWLEQSANWLAALPIVIALPMLSVSKLLEE